MPVLLVVIVASIAALVVLLRDRRESAPLPPSVGDFGERLTSLVARRGASGRNIAADETIRKVDGVFVRTWRIVLPDAAARDGLAADVEAEAAAWQARVERTPPGPAGELRLRVDLGTEAFDLRLVAIPPQVVERAPTPTPVPSPTPRPTLSPDRRGRLAILLDDGGQNLDLVPAASKLHEAVAVAVLPFLPHSAETATALHRAGHEVWLHLPMEASGASDNPGPGAVLVSMSEGEIRSTVHSAINNVPHAVGVNNHMGSKASADLRTMTWVMQELAARGMAFIDSRTTVRTVAEDAARMQGVRAGRRHVFLDNQRSRAAIRAQLDEAVYRARAEGGCLAIGHLTQVTVEVLVEELPRLDARGATLVTPLELLPD